MEIGVDIPINFAPPPHTGRLFDEFVLRCQSFLTEFPHNVACKRIVDILPHVLINKSLIELIGNRQGRNVAFEESHGGLTVLAHYHPHEVQSQPHDHGRTWAIYGVVTGFTAMWEWELVEPPTEQHKGKVKLTNSYWVFPGEAHYFPVGAIHSHRTYEDSRLLRLEGMNIHRKSLNIGGKYFEPINDPLY